MRDTSFRCARARQVIVLSLVMIAVAGAGPAAGWATADSPAVVQKTTVRLEDVPQTIAAEVFDPGFPQGDSNYLALCAASDGLVYFAVSTHDPDHACRFYAFDPAAAAVRLVAKMDRVAGEDARRQVSQGKIHTPLIEFEGKLWFATHTSVYDGDLPATEAGDRALYTGGRFMNYDLSTKTFTDLGKVMPSEGIITCNLDPKHKVMYGLTWPSGLLVTYDIAREQMWTWGAVQARGEWGHQPGEWDRICRTLGIDPDGNVYGAVMDGRIWKFEPGEHRPVRYLEGLDLRKVPFSQSSAAERAGSFLHNWRVIEWNPVTGTFWGLHFETSTLFEFDPEAEYIRAVAELRPEAYRWMPRNPEISQLGFTIGPRNTIFYLAHGPAVEIPDRPPVQSGLYLLTYNLDTHELTDHGPILTQDGRRVFFAESIAIGADGHIYTVAWVEVVSAARRQALQEARGAGPIETADMVYEMLLTRLPQSQTFVKDAP